MTILTRKNAETMPLAEWNRFVESLQVFKDNGGYDQKTMNHSRAMATMAPWSGDNGSGTFRNVAHRGPAFLPWHRQFLRELELALVAIQANLFPGAEPVALPYWRWNVNVDNWWTSSIFNRIGGDGNPSNGRLINSGPFAGWTSVIDIGGGNFGPRPGIVRQFGTWGSMPVWDNNGIAGYDVSPWNEFSNMGTSYRNTYEDKHNWVHVLIGGDMWTSTAPNDPIFYLHHCNIDRAWTYWQQTHGVTTYQPNGQGPSGHNEDDAPIFLDSYNLNPSKTIAQMLDGLNFEGQDACGTSDGFTYDTINP